MSLLASQSSARMAGNLCYVAAQTFALMVAVIDLVCRTGANERQLKVLQGAFAGMREEARD